MFGFSHKSKIIPGIPNIALEKKNIGQPRCSAIEPARGEARTRERAMTPERREYWKAE